MKTIAKSAPLKSAFNVVIDDTKNEYREGQNYNVNRINRNGNILRD